MEIDVVNREMKKIGQTDLLEGVFKTTEKPHLWHEVVRWQMAKKRQGTAHTKDRSEITGSTRKIYRQKGTGRARHGSLKAPIFRSGGIVFGPKTRSYYYALPRRVKRMALCSALSAKWTNEKIRIVDSLEIETLKTKTALAMLEKFSFKTALVIDVGNHPLARAIRNVKGFKVVEPEGLNVYDLMKFDGLIMTQSALARIQEDLDV